MPLDSIVVYRDNLLPISETFIFDQVESLTRFNAYYAGCRFVKGIKLSNESTFVINKKKGSRFGILLESLFIRYGISSKFNNRFNIIQPKLVHAHFGVGASNILPFVMRKRIKLIVTYHGFDATTTDKAARMSFFGHRLYLLRRNQLIEYVSTFIAVSEFIKRKMIEQGIPSDKIIVHYTGIDLEKFLIDSSIVREKIVLFVGRLVEQKGCYYLLKAMKEVQKKHLNCKLVVIGDGPQRLHLEELSHNEQIDSIFLGSLTHKEVRKWMNRSMIFSVPSIKMETGAEEGLGMVFVEANAMGLPVVSTATGGIPEVIEHEVTGLLVKEKDIRMITDSINTLLSNRDLWDKMSMNGIKRAKELFDIRLQANKLQDIYQQVIER
ncbi:hypothetical protein PAT3040_00891 [Paenibacillus agaridevorans]|uniref:Glycosyl transferase n=1 Tax=Paenibacillus agaridevorans TaxID=171404 RepID=A0A2R5EIE0_9BACL|nr:glycosyltransferase [Paenibacillus agaridevorans]GBG06366.1 hypothetical protein PAT3040_00891 [Paenibacillus agaridevorans]